MSDTDVKTTLANPGFHDAWSRIYRGPEHEGYYAYAFDLANHYYGGTEPGPVLDAGCGTGNHIRHLTQRGYDVCGIDYSEYAISMAHKVLDEICLGRKVTLEVADLLSLPFPEGKFSRVLCWGVLMHIPSVEKAISELCRITAPSGRIVICEANMDALQVKLAGFVRKLLKRPLRGNYRRTPEGVETWDGPSDNQIVARRSNIGWLINAFQSHGFRCIGRHVGEVTEIYAELDNPFWRQAVHALNRAGYRWLKAPGLAATNILVFEKIRS
jgi:ubiquinone/menaquinone biosynthesis C-methylase UbiE